MDELDERIAAVLSRKGKATASEIAGIVHLSAPAVSERIRKMEQTGIIEKYIVRIHRPAVGLPVLAYVFVNLASSDAIDPFRDQVLAFPEVLECYHIAGSYDYLLKVVAASLADLDDFLGLKLKKIPGISRSHTQICLRTLKEEVNGYAYVDV